MSDRHGSHSGYQDTAEVKGLTLNTEPTLELVRELQKNASDWDAEQTRNHRRGKSLRLRLLAGLTLALWLTVLIVLLARV